MRVSPVAIAVAGVLVLGMSPAYAVDLSISTEPYLESGLYASQVLPIEGEQVTFGIEARIEGSLKAQPRVEVEFINGRDVVIGQARFALTINGDRACGQTSWTPPENGMYRVRAILDPKNEIEEIDAAVAAAQNEEAGREAGEANNTAELLLPVIVKDRPLFFPWYRGSEWVRWANVITSVKAETAAPLAARGIKALGWEYGGFSWSYFDDKRLDTDREAAEKELDELFYGKYSRQAPEPLAGFGIDEIGGYPGSAKEAKSIISMRAMARAKKEDPSRFFAVWHTGRVDQPLAGLHRQAADLLLLETYVGHAIPHGLGAEDIYQVIRDRLDPVVRSGDMLIPAYGNHCYTLIALDTSERPDLMTLAEQEQIIRFIRRICPEMRGIAFYNSGYGKYGLVRTEATDAHHEEIVRNADRLCLDYFVKPCITLQRESLWVTQEEDETVLTAALSNIGAMDSGSVLVRFYQDGKPLASTGVPCVPAGPNRNENRAQVRITIDTTPGTHTYRVEIVEARNATVLDAVMTETQFLR